MVGEECGVIACFLKKKSVRLPSVLYFLLSELQHRGQTSAGITVCSMGSRKPLKSLKSVGKVANLFKTWDKVFFEEVMNNYGGDIGIGHVRYATSNVSDSVSLSLEEAQPFIRSHGRPWKRFAIAFNGHLTNAPFLKKGLIEKGYILDSDVDTEILMHLTSLSLKKNWVDTPEGVFKVFEDVIGQLDGSFSFVFVNALGDLVIARDKWGFRPLVIGENNDMICIASESKALKKVGIEKFRDVEPGEIILIRNCEIHSTSVKKDSRTAHCHFEYVYFSDTCSISDGILVNDVRRNLGTILGKEEMLRNRFGEGDWVVIPIPSTSIPAAVAYSNETKIPVAFSLIKSDVGRGFINSSSMRKTIMDSKYNIVPRSVEGKKVILIDDSIIRGETSERIVKLIRDAGAKEVHFRVSEMPIKFPCCYGVDFPSFEELVAGNFKGSCGDVEKFVAKKIGVDSMGFVSFEGLKEALGGGSNKFCFACLNGKYPTGAGCDFINGKLKDY